MEQVGKIYPYLRLPIKDQFYISEGWIYSPHERKLHGNYHHKGIDFSVRYGTPVYASADGFAVASYHRFPLLNRDFTFKLFEDMPMANGLGYFVQIYHPESVCKVKGGRITQYGHLASIDACIKIKTNSAKSVNHTERLIKVNDRRREQKLSKAQLDKQISECKKIIERYPWVSKYYGYSKNESYLYSLPLLEKLHKEGNRYVTYLKQGDLIGYVGTSAIFYGNPPYRENLKVPHIKEHSDVWDETHLHFEEACRDENGVKKGQRDIFGVYKSYRWYQPDIKSQRAHLELFTK